MTLKYRHFTGLFQGWESLFAEAAEFASRIGPERVINISQAADSLSGSVVVWYWDDGD